MTSAAIALLATVAVALVNYSAELAQGHFSTDLLWRLFLTYLVVLGLTIWIRGARK